MIVCGELIPLYSVDVVHSYIYGNVDGFWRKLVQVRRSRPAPLTPTEESTAGCPKISTILSSAHGAPTLTRDSLAQPTVHERNASARSLGSVTLDIGIF